MAGIPFLFVFGVLGLLALRRGWGWLAVISVFCMGVGAADTAVGRIIYSAATGGLSQLWSLLVGVLNSAV